MSQRPERRQPNGRDWRDLDTALVALYGTATVPELATQLGERESTIKNRLAELRQRGVIKRRKPMPLQELDVLLAQQVIELGGERALAAKIVGCSLKQLERAFRARQIRVRQIRQGSWESYTVSRFAALFQVHIDTVNRWVREGHLTVQRAQRRSGMVSPRKLNKTGRRIGRRLQARIDAVNLWEFLMRRTVWPEWEPRQIRHDFWRMEAEQIRKDAGGRWVSLRVLAERYGCSGSVLRQLMQSQEWPVERLKVACQWFVWEPTSEQLPDPPLAWLRVGRKRSAQPRPAR